MLYELALLLLYELTSLVFYSFLLFIYFELASLSVHCNAIQYNYKLHGLFDNFCDE